MKLNRKSRRMLVFGVAVAAVAGGGFVAGQIFSVGSTAQTKSSDQADSGTPIPADGGSVFADVAANVGPGVVFIRTERTWSRSQDRGRFQIPEFFRDFLPDDENHRDRRIPGGGSGFIFDDEGRILTNHHVVRDADEIVVIMATDNGEVEFLAEIVGTDARSDIAIIQIDPPKSGLPIVPLGDSDKCRVGDWVMAIGTPFGQLQGTVTAGIISAKERSDLNIMGSDPGGYQNYIQTDASINFGNSGGPLVNLKGEAIGINTAINPTGQGIGFAIPINMAKDIMGQLIAGGRVQYGFIGITLDELNKDLAEGLGLAVKQGILVNNVLEGYPAELAGIEKKDVIVEYDGEAVRDASKFRLMVAKTPIGETVPIVVWRDGKKKSMKITIAERPEDAVVAVAPPAGGGSWLGLQVDEADSRQMRQQFNTARGQKGVVVLEVEKGSPADEAGIREGDIITEVYSIAVDNLNGYLEVADKLKDREAPIAFLVKRGRSTTYIPVKPDKR
ncbi:MAG: trypsin-like peptidase domain-containing protein [Candidatus Krumholzibacteria bacterium]|nr:trypsin-like peptidase domain-containing protein [Candidatus Krumholzibacteria bacterium]